MENLRDLLEQTVEEHGDARAYRLKIAPEQYNDITYSEHYEDIKALGEAFIKEGFAQHRIAEIGKNSYEWMLVDEATQITAGVAVPLDKELRYSEFELSLVRSEVKVIFYDRKEKEMVDKAIVSGKTFIERTYALYECEEPNIFDLLEKGRACRRDGSREVEKVEIDENAVSYLLFTSGTTSQSKIVMLSQRNLYADIYNTLAYFPFYVSDVNIALLPYHHTFGLVGQWMMMAVGMSTVYCDGLKYIQKNLQEYKVTVFIGVPLIMEQMYKKIMKIAEKEHMTGKLKAAATMCRVLNKTGINVNRKVFKGVLDALGGELRLVIMGAAAADPACVKGFADFGVLAVQGYGLTETSPVLSAERKGFQKPGSVGRAIPGVELKIFDPDENGIGEIIARGANVMKGYYKDAEATNAVIKDGWFHTGDLGYFDKDGFLFITGRKKNMICLKNGKNIFPEELEQEIAALPYQVESIVVGIPNNGDERDPVVCLKMAYDPEMFEGKTHDEIHDAVAADIEKINETVPAYKRIHRIYVTDEPMEKTSTGKVRRFKEIEKIVAEEAEK